MTPHDHWPFSGPVSDDVSDDFHGPRPRRPSRRWWLLPFAIVTAMAARSLLGCAEPLHMVPVSGRILTPTAEEVVVEDAAVLTTARALAPHADLDQRVALRAEAWDGDGRIDGWEIDSAVSEPLWDDGHYAVQARAEVPVVVGGDACATWTVIALVYEHPAMDTGLDPDAAMRLDEATVHMPCRREAR